MSDQFTIRQSEFAEKHGLLAGEMKELRNKWLKEGHDWCKKGVPVFLTENAVKVLEGALLLKENGEGEAEERSFVQDGVTHTIAGFGPPAENPNAIHLVAEQVEGGRKITLPVTFYESSFPTGEDAAHEVAAAVREERMQARVIKQCTNKRMIYASLEGERIAVRIGNVKFQKLKGKTLNVQKVPDSEIYEIAP